MQQNTVRDRVFPLKPVIFLYFFQWLGLLALYIGFAKCLSFQLRAHRSSQSISDGLVYRVIKVSPNTVNKQALD